MTIVEEYIEALAPASTEGLVADATDFYWRAIAALAVDDEPDPGDVADGATALGVDTEPYAEDARGLAVAVLRAAMSAMGAETQQIVGDVAQMTVALGLATATTDASDAETAWESARDDRDAAALIRAAAKTHAEAVQADADLAPLAAAADEALEDLSAAQTALQQAQQTSAALLARGCPSELLE